jgi:hypothetical protein
MAGDFSRNSFVKDKHYSGVLIQQGRVQIDADWNEQWEIQRHRIMTEAVDTIGHSGVPKKGGGFKIGVTADGSDITISAGRIYVGGLLCELEKTVLPTTYLNQPYYPDPDVSDFNIVPGSGGGTGTGGGTGAPGTGASGASGSGASGAGIGSPISSPPGSPLSGPPSSPPSASLKDGTYLVYLDAWQQEINFHDDPHIHEVALGEADTAIRIENAWQVKLWRVPDTASNDATCDSYFPGWEKAIAAPTGKLNARVITPANPTNPCQLPPTSGYRGLENQLYRVEVQSGGTAATATFKWSRDNATVETLITDIDNTTITVPDLGRDNASLGFSFGQWVEVVDEESTLQRSPNPLVTIQNITPSPDGIQVLVSDPVGQYEGMAGLKLRRWDQVTNAGANGVRVQTGTWLDLENGIQVSFQDGTYYPGDFWVIPARTATGNIEWPPFTAANGVDAMPGAPIPQLPMGVHHYHCRLALLEVSGGVIVAQDCRHKFPALTEIDASDVWFNNNTCDLAGANTVQEALDQLCTANTMRDHNKYLHGTGVVCGLQVNCGYQRQTVTVQPGYAIDCNGDVIRITTTGGVTYPIVANATQYLNGEGSGAVSLILNSGTGTPTFSLEKYVKKTFWEEVLDGTLLKDFYTDSVGKLLTFVKTEFSSLTPVAPVPIGQRRLTSLLNLLSQVLNSATGPYAFLSGAPGPRSMTTCTGGSDEMQSEDKLLWCLYQDLKNLLTSQTFCGLFDNDRPFPDYTIAPGLQTIFGPPLQTHTRLVLSPDGKYAYTAGSGNTVYMYDLGTQQLLNILTFPASSTIVIKDLVVSPDSTQLVVLGVVNNLDSYFAIATISSTGTYTWSPTSVACATQFARLRYGPPTPGPGSPPTPVALLYGTVLTQGLFQITGIGTPAFTTLQTGPVFNATGMFIFDATGNYAFAAANSTSGIQTSFNQIVAINATPAGMFIGTTEHNWNGIDADNDLLYSGVTLYVTGYSPSNSSQRALGFILGLEDQVAPGNNFTAVSIGQSTTTRLATTGNYLLVSMSDQCKVSRFNMNTLLSGSGFRIPTQLYPIAIGVSADATTGYVLNTLVDTLTVINFKQVFNTATPPDYALDPPTATDSIAAYRSGVIDAYQDLLNHLLQFFKDSFCDRFLIDCPTCTGNEKIYLGTIEIRKNKVYKICNFRKRKYVKTFRTVSYWLSTIPVLPVVRESLTRFCCSVMGATTKSKKV